MADCCCDSGAPTRLLYACSGAADVGRLADQVTRKLAGQRAGKMTCLAGLGGGLSGFIASARAAGENLVLDGCKVACGRKLFENLGIPCRSVLLTDFGVEKGKTHVTPELIDETTTAVAGAIGMQVGGQVGGQCGCGAG